jgi:hypothetical protein
MIEDLRRSLKRSELASGVGALVLGAGLGLLAPMSMQQYAVPMVVAGIALHATGMTLKYRLERRQSGALMWWEVLLFWTCWLGLAALAILLTFRFL